MVYSVVTLMYVVGSGRNGPVHVCVWGGGGGGGGRVGTGQTEPTVE